MADYLSASAADGEDLEAYVDRVNDREDVVPVAVITADGTTYGPELPGAERGGLGLVPAARGGRGR